MSIFKRKTPNNRTFYRIDGKLYDWFGWLGTQLVSREWFRPPAGTVREILGERFHVTRTERRGWLIKTHWALSAPEGWQNERIEMFRDKLLRMP